MITDLVSVSPEADQKEVAQVVRDSRLLAIPVLDPERHMVGIVTIDDIVDVVEEEASRDIQNIGGAEAIDGPYLHTTFLEMVRSAQVGWPFSS
jgi:magnesium transporter